MVGADKDVPSGAERASEEADELDPDQLRAELHEAIARVDAAEAKAGEYLDDMQRIKAEFENYRKRMLRDQTDAISRASSGLITALLDVLDDFDLALAAAEAMTGEHEAVTKGIEQVYAKLIDTLGKEGLRRVDEAGVPFDTSIHEAVAHDESGPADGELIVDDVFRAGYAIGPKILRPAMVKVTRRAAHDGESPEG